MILPGSKNQLKIVLSRLLIRVVIGVKISFMNGDPFLVAQAQWNRHVWRQRVLEKTANEDYPLIFLGASTSRRSRPAVSGGSEFARYYKLGLLITAS